MFGHDAISTHRLTLFMALIANHYLEVTDLLKKCAPEKQDISAKALCTLLRLEKSSEIEQKVTGSSKSHHEVH